MIVLYIFLGVFAALVFVFLFMGLKIVSQTNVYIIERLGSYRKTLTNGVNWIIPIIDRVVLKETLKERVLDFPEQDVITKDNVTMKIDTVVYLQITDPKLYAYGVQRPLSAVENLTATTLRNLVGDLELDQTLTSRDTINEKLREILDESTDPWGIKVLRVELKNILPPVDIIKAMEKQMRAERNKRENILVAEGIKQADILKAEGEKAAAILTAEGVREQRILEAEGKKKAIELINESKPTKSSMIIKGYDALVETANSSASTIIIPSELTAITSLAATFKAVVGDSNNNKKAVKTKKTLDEILDNI